MAQVRSLIPHLNIRGAAEAIDFYKKAFGAKEIRRLPGPDGKVMHAELRIGDATLFLVDEYPDYGAKAPPTLGGTPVTVDIIVDKDADALFNQAVAAGAKVTMPIADMFWGDRYGKLVDPFGHDWSISMKLEELSEAEIARRGQEAMKQFKKP